MIVRDVMTTSLIVVPPQAPVRDIVNLIVRHQISGIPVVNDDGTLAGMVSEADLVPSEVRVPYTSKKAPALFSEFVHPDEPLEPYTRIDQYTAADLMRVNVPCVQADKDLADVTSILSDGGIRQVPVLEGAKLVGIVTRKDLLRAVAGSDRG